MLPTYLLTNDIEWSILMTDYTIGEHIAPQGVFVYNTNMPNYRKKLRNESLVYDREVLGLTYTDIAKKYRIARSTACEVFMREKKKAGYVGEPHLSTILLAPKKK